MGGAKNSYHLLGLAVDFKPTESNPELLAEVFEIIAKWSDVVGLGIYESGIIHIDLRPSKLFWCKPLKRKYKYFDTAANTLGFYKALLEA